MKTKIRLLILSLVLPLVGFAQARISYSDDIYFTKEDRQRQTEKQKQEYSRPVNDTVYYYSEKRDSLGKLESYEEGYYINKSDDESENEYAQRIKRFHTTQPPISYYDYYDNYYNWDSYYWGNPYWHNYSYYQPYNYYRYNPYNYYYSYNPWSYWNNYYYGWNYYSPYYGYYRPYYHHHWDGYSHYNKPSNYNYSENSRRQQHIGSDYRYDGRRVNSGNSTNSSSYSIGNSRGSSSNTTTSPSNNSRRSYYESSGSSRSSGGSSYSGGSGGRSYSGGSSSGSSTYSGGSRGGNRR